MRFGRADGGAYFDPHIAHVVLARFSNEKTSDAQFVAADRSRNRDPAVDLRRPRQRRDRRKLHIGLGTVKGHIRDILEKLSASDRTQAAVWRCERAIFNRLRIARIVRSAAPFFTITIIASPAWRVVSPVGISRSASGRSTATTTELCGKSISARRLLSTGDCSAESRA